jgi:hypothetical protein
MRLKQKKSIKFRCVAIAAQVVFIFTQLYLYSTYVGHSYAQQRYIQQRASLEHAHQEALQELCHAQDLTAIKEFAKTKLGMHKINVGTIKQLKRG